jgi:hypothetical protein
MSKPNLWWNGKVFLRETVLSKEKRFFEICGIHDWSEKFDKVSRLNRMDAV